MYRFFLFFLIFILISCTSYKNIFLLKPDELLYGISVCFHNQDNSFRPGEDDYDFIDTTKSFIYYYDDYRALHINHEKYEKLLSEIRRIDTITDEKVKDLSITIVVHFNYDKIEWYRFRGKTQMRELVFKTNDILGFILLDTNRFDDFISK